MSNMDENNEDGVGVFNPEIVMVKSWTEKVNISQLCRICANTSDCLISIFEGEGVEHELSSKINKHLHLKVSPEDKLPKNVCYPCASTLIAWHDMSISCVEADKKLHSLIDDLPASSASEDEFCDDNQSMDLDDYKDDADLDEKVLPIDEAPESLTFVDVSTIKRGSPPTAKSSGNRTKSITELSKVAKEEANAVRESDSNVSDEVTKIKSDEASTSVDQDEDITIDKPSTGNTDESIVPSKEYNQTETQTNHVNKIKNAVKVNKTMGVKFVCDICDKKFCRSYTLKKHRFQCGIELTNRTNDDEIVGDNIGKSKNKDDEPLCYIIDETTKKKLYSCEVCRKILGSKGSYVRHVRIHTNESLFLCHACEKSFRSRWSLVRHLQEVHEGIRTVPCDLCGKKFSNKTNRDDHRRIHTGERPYICSVCGKMFKSKANLYCHNKYHSKDFPFICLECGKGFRRSYEMNRHYRIHTGEKPYSCEKCGKGFRVKSELGRHLALHSDETPFVCSYCVDKSFKTKRCLKYHVMKCHSSVPEALNMIS